MIENISNSAIKHLKTTEASLTRSLRRDAINAGWPKDIAKKLSIQVNADDVSVIYPEDAEESIGDLEYGSAGESARPVLRMFVRRHQTEISNELEDWLSTLLVKLEDAQ